MTTTRMILDCDTGTDDAIALLAAVGHPALELVGVTTVSGNVPLDHTTDNTLRVLDFAGVRVPVHRGADRPLMRDDLPVPRAVLNAGNPEFQLATLDLPEAVSRVADRSAVEFLVDTYLGENADDITLVATGPLTNIAAALAAEPLLAGRIPRLVVMGGAVAGGNVTAAAEFNFWADPEAAAAVVGARLRQLDILPLDATHSAPVTLEDCDTLDALGTPQAAAVSRLVRHRIATDGDGGADAAPVHDALCVAALADPDVLTRVVRRPAAVETVGDLTTGQLVVDRRPWISDRPATRVALAADHDRFLAFLVAALG